MARKDSLNPPALDTRAAGILLHPTSLPGPLGSGDLGPQAYAFADSLKQAGIRWWQMLPTTPPGPAPGFSPYSSHSAFAGSLWLISPELLREMGLLSRRDLASAKQTRRGRIDFGRDRKTRIALLKAAFANRSRLSPREQAEQEQFARDSAHWLNDHALYVAIKNSHREKPWIKWPADLRLRQPAALAHERRRLAELIAFEIFVQWLFHRQWKNLKTHCNRLGIGLIGDVPIFVSHDSDAVWAHRDLFLLDRNGKPTVVSGYPADEFSPLGQLWGHPHYRWPAHVSTGFNWWIQRFAKAMNDFDAVRIDHFLGFYRLWTVPASAKNAVRGKWQCVPGDELFAALRKRLKNAPIIAEDLGSPIPAQLALRDKYKFPGMRILQFAFGDSPYHRPHDYPRRCVAYTGTHDNPTILGWYDNLTGAELARADTYTGIAESEPHWNFIRILFTSVANTVIIPVQDALGLGSAHRMNVPGVATGNWDWRMDGPIPASVLQQLRALSEASGRFDPKP